MYIEYFGHIFMALYFFLKMIFPVETFIIYISMLIMKDCTLSTIIVLDLVHMRKISIIFFNLRFGQFLMKILFERHSRQDN